MTMMMTGGEGEKTFSRPKSKGPEHNQHDSCRVLQNCNTTEFIPRGEEGERQAAPCNLFKKPRLDVSLVRRDHHQLTCVNGEEVHDSPRCNNVDSKSFEEFVAGCLGECCTCGVVGFQAELFRCTKCHTRVQHTYCSNSYNPRKRWFIGLCNWCEADMAAVRGTAAAGTPKQLVQEASTKRGDRSVHYFGNRGEAMNALDCLLGAALRLPSAGLSCVEDLLQGVQSKGLPLKRRKAPSFDSVEKARRSGPCGDDKVKSINRPVKLEGEARSSSTSFDTAERSRSEEAVCSEALKVKVKKSPMAIDCTPTSSSTGDAKAEVESSRKECNSSVVDVKAETVETSTKECKVVDAAIRKNEDKPQSSSIGSEVVRIEKFKRSAPADDSIKVDRKLTKSLKLSPKCSPASSGSGAPRNTSYESPKSSGSGAPRNISYESPKSSGSGGVGTGHERSSEGSHDNISTLKTKRTDSFIHRERLEADQKVLQKRTDSFHTTKKSVETEAEFASHVLSRRKENINLRRSPKAAHLAPRESCKGVDANKMPSLNQRTMSIENSACKLPAAHHNLHPVEKVSTKSSPGADYENSSEKSSRRSPTATSDSAGGGSDCSNITEHRNGKDCSSPKRSFLSKEAKRAPAHILLKQLEERRRRPSITGPRCTTPRHYQIAGKSPRDPIMNKTTPTSNDEKVQKKITSHKDSSTKQLRRSSSKITVFHNYKSLSDILC